MIEKLAKAKYSGNTFRAWGEGTPEQNRLIDAILKSNMHIIATLRVKSEYVVESNDKGKSTPRKIGLSPKQREGIEYEFDMHLSGNEEHYFKFEKDRTGKYQDEIIQFPDENLGKDLIEWLSSGKAVLTIKERIENCKTRAELLTIWTSLNKAQQSEYLELKNIQKDKLTE